MVCASAATRCPLSLFLLLSCGPATIEFAAPNPSSEDTSEVATDTAPGDSVPDADCDLVLEPAVVSLTADEPVAYIRYPECVGGAAVACTEPFTGSFSTPEPLMLALGVSWSPSSAATGSCVVHDARHGTDATVAVTWTP